MTTREFKEQFPELYQEYFGAYEYRGPMRGARIDGEAPAAPPAEPPPVEPAELPEPDKDSIIENLLSTLAEYARERNTNSTDINITVASNKSRKLLDQHSRMLQDAFERMTRAKHPVY